ncbi:hypothetical protein LCGC14_2590780, partial [marine sediment metagenome]
MTNEIQEYSQTQAALSVLRERYTNVTFAVATTDGMKAAKEARADVRGYRTGLEKMRKELKAPALERSRLIDAEARSITEELLELEKPIDIQIKKFEAKIEAERQAKIEAEVKRVEDIQDRIAELRSAVTAVSCMGTPTSEKVQDFIDDINAIAVDSSFGEFEDQAKDAKTATLATLRELFAAAIEREKEAARIAAEREELDKLRAEAEKREVAARKRRETAEAKAREKRKAEDKQQ